MAHPFGLGIGGGLAFYGTGANISGAVSDAETLAGSETDALAIVYTDDHFKATTGFNGSVYCVDSGTPANDYSNSPTTETANYFTYTSPSPKMILHDDGVLKYNAHNLYLNSASPANQAITVVSGATYAVTITGSVSVTASGAATGTWTAGTNTFTAATTTLTLGSTSGSGTVHVRRTPSDSTYMETAGSIRYADPIEFNSSGTSLGQLVEPQRTNLALRSKEFSNAEWTEYGNIATIPAASVTGPDGLTSGTVFTATAGISFKTTFSTVKTIPAATVHTVSVFAKAGTTQYVSLNIEYSSNVYISAVFDVGAANTTATETSTGASSGTVVATKQTAYPNGWYRCELAFSAPLSSLGYIEIGFAGGATGNTFNTTGQVTYNLPSGTQTLNFYGAQLEVGSSATSPIETFGSSVTRAADAVSRAVTAYAHSATVNSGMVEYVPKGSASTATVALRWDDGTANEVVSIGHDASGNIGLTVTDGGAAQTAPLTSGTVTNDATETIGFSWKANDFLLSDNGATAVADTSGTLPTVTTLKIGSSGGPIYVKRILIVPVEKTAAEVEAYGAL